MHCDKRCAGRGESPDHVAAWMNDNSASNATCGVRNAIRAFPHVRRRVSSVMTTVCVVQHACVTSSILMLLWINSVWSTLLLADVMKVWWRSCDFDLFAEDGRKGKVWQTWTILYVLLGTSWTLTRKSWSSIISSHLTPPAPLPQTPLVKLERQYWLDPQQSCCDVSFDQWRAVWLWRRAPSHTRRRAHLPEMPLRLATKAAEQDVGTTRWFICHLPDVTR